MKNILISIVLFASTVFLPGCLDSGSDTSRDVNVIVSFPSPNQSYVATSYNSSGGGAGGWCYFQVNVRRQSEQFNPDNGIIFVTTCKVRPDVRWETERKLTIGYPADTTIYTQENTWSGGEDVEISYVPK
jgi:hypothetical protein